MAQTIKLKRSATQGNIPTTAQLDLGEVAINTYDGKMYLKKDDGTESVVEVGAGSGGGISDIVEDTTPQLGGDLDLNSSDITGTGDIDITGTITTSEDITINSITVGRGGSSLTTNTAVGTSALLGNTTGFDNTATGNGALQANTTGVGNTASGHYSLATNTGGGSNTATGFESLYKNTSGNSNVAVGYRALRNNTTGRSNVAIGLASGINMTTGIKNTIIGGFSGNEGGLDIRTSDNYIVLSDGDGNPRQVIDGSGNAGIGVTSPSTKLDVDGVITATGGNSTNWNTAYGWGDHAAAGYSTSSGLGNIVEDTTPQLGGTLDANGNTIDMGTNVITDTKVGQWDTAYGWGNHASAGYITSNQPITLSGDVSGSGTTNITVTVADDSHNHIISNVDGLQAALDGKVDDSQVLTNVPSGAVFTDTTYSVGNGGLTEINFTSALNSKLAGIEAGANNYTLPFTDNSTNWNTAYGWGDHSTEGYLTSSSLSGYATESYVGTAIANVIDSAPTTLDTLNELAEALGDDPNFATTTATSIGGKLAKASNLSDLTNAATARTNLGLGTAATTNSTAYATAAQGTRADSALQSNQTITLTGDASGSGTTSINVTIADDSHNHSISNVDGLQTALDAKLALAGGTMTGRLVLPDTGYSIGNEYHTWKRSYTINNTSPAELLYHDGNSLPSGGVYRFHAHISITGTDQSATAVYWNENGTWKVNVTYQSGASSNHPEFIIGGSPEKPQIHIDHTSNYVVEVLAERLELSEEGGTDNKSGFGTDAFLGSVGGNLRYNDGGSGNNYEQGNVVWHAGNDGSGSGLDADLLDGQEGSYYYPASNPNGYTNDQTAAEILTAIKTVDGSGSGLDADLLDGQQGSYYVNTSTTQTISGIKSFSSETKFGLNYVDPDSGIARDAKFGDNGIAVSGGIKTDTLNGGTPWTSANDGSGSGLDADLLDGQHGSYYYAASNPSNYTSNVGDITAVTAGTGLSGGGTSGSVTLNLSDTMSPAVATELSSSVDLDTLNGAQAGFYYQTANADTTGNNYPNGNAGSLIVQKSAGNATQLYQTYSDSPELFFRSNYTTGYSDWRKVWNSGNDGSGSGLDADLLDGQHASAFQPAGTYNTIIGTDTDIDTSGSTIIDNIFVTDGVITSMGTRTLTAADLGALTGNQTITLSGDITGSGTTSINAQIAANVVGANELNVSGNGTAGQVLQSDGDGSMTWTTPSSGGVTTGKSIAMAIVFG